MQLSMHAFQVAMGEVHKLHISLNADQHQGKPHLLICGNKFRSALVSKGKLIFTNLLESAQVTDTSAHSQKSPHLLNTYSCSLFTDALHI